MKLWKYILSASLILLNCPSFEFQNVSSSTLVSNNSSSTTISSISLSTNTSTVNTATNSSLSSNITTAKLTTQTFGNSTVNSVTTTLSTSVFTNTPISSTYRSRVRVQVSFNDTFLPDYNSMSAVLYSYLQTIFSKLSAAMPTQILKLNALYVFSVVPGSVVIDMSTHLRSNYAINDSMLITSVTNALLKAFPQSVIIMKMSVALSSTLVRKKTITAPWIVGLVIAGIVALIMIIVALVLWYRYYPNKCCFRKRQTTTAVAGNSLELEYDSAYNDKHPIVF